MALLRKHYKKKNDTQTISKEQGKQSGEKHERENTNQNFGKGS
jgi:hypothetical protein